MPNINSIDNAISSVYVENGSNGSGIYTRMNAGAHITNASSGYPELFIPQSQIATAIGLTATKIVSGNTILGLAGTSNVAPYDLGNYLKGSSFTISEQTNNSSSCKMVGKMIYWSHFYTSSNYLKFKTKTFNITGYKTLKVSYVLPTNDYTGISVKLIDADGTSVTAFSGGGNGSKSITVSSLSGNTYIEISSQGKGVECYISELYLFK